MEENTPVWICKHIIEYVSEIHCVWDSSLVVGATLSMELVLVGRDQSCGSDSFVYPNYPLIHTMVNRAILKRTLSAEKFE